VSDGEQATTPAPDAAEPVAAASPAAEAEAVTSPTAQAAGPAVEAEAVTSPTAEAEQASPALETEAASPAPEAVSAPAEAASPAAAPAADPVIETEPVTSTPAEAEPVTTPVEAVAGTPAEPEPVSVPAAPVPAPPASAPVSSPVEAVSVPAAPAGPPVEAASPWGRVAADGTVYVRRADGEHEIGNWAAGSPAEGLAFYQTRYDGLKTKVDLLERRLRGDGGKDSAATIAELRAAITDAHAIGDLDALLTRLGKLDELAEQRRSARKEARAKELAEAAQRKEQIVGEAETLAESAQWKSTGERLRALVDEWKAVPRLDRKSDDELWNRFAAARSAFAKRRKAHFAELDAERDVAKGRKEELVEEAEELAGQPINQPSDWAEIAQAFRDLMARWKKAGHAQREVEDKLWVRFKAAQDGFFAARNADLDKRDAGFKENLAKKQELLTEAQGLLPGTDLRAAKAGLRKLQERWEAIGPVPRDAKGRIEGQLRDVERAVADAEQAEWQRTNPEARARAEATVRQLEVSIEKFQKELEKAKASGNSRKTADAEAAISARREWLEQAQAALAEFTR
jgi:hypothetical protein